MTQPTVITHGEITSLRNLISAVRELGIGIPGDVQAELEIRKRVEGDGQVSQRAHTESIARLYSAPAEDFDKALSAAADAAARLRAEQELTSVIEAASVHRLSRAVLSATPDWMSEATRFLNQVVSDYQLNEHAEHLPDLADPGFSALSISGAAGSALEAWRTAGPLLGQGWELYRRIATFEGHTIGPDSELSVNLFTTAVLGNPGSWGRAQAAAHTLAEFSYNVDPVKPWRTLAPHITCALHGFELNFSTLADAERIRRNFQAAA